MGNARIGALVGSPGARSVGNPDDCAANSSSVLRARRRRGGSRVSGDESGSPHARTGFWRSSPEPARQVHRRVDIGTSAAQSPGRPSSPAKASTRGPRARGWDANAGFRRKNTSVLTGASQPVPRASGNRGTVVIRAIRITRISTWRGAHGARAVRQRAVSAPFANGRSGCRPAHEARGKRARPVDAAGHIGLAAERAAPPRWLQPPAEKHGDRSDSRPDAGPSNHAELRRRHGRALKAPPPPRAA